MKYIIYDSEHCRPVLGTYSSEADANQAKTEKMMGLNPNSKRYEVMRIQ